MLKTILKYTSFFLFLISAIHCSNLKNPQTKTPEAIKSSTDTIAIVNKEVKYEVIIIDNGFNRWLQSIAQPRGYFSQNYLEIKNNIFTTHWNIRALNPTKYNRNLYTLQIDYDSTIDYGYEVNYLLYNYFLFFQEKYQQNLLRAN